MAFQVSPGVEVKEIDATNVIPAVSTSIGATAGHFSWGPVEKVVTVSSEKELVEEFGSPSAKTVQHVLAAGGFLKYGSALKVSRAKADGAVNATSSGTGIYIGNEDQLPSKVASFGTTDNWIARYPGELGNNLTVSTCCPAGFASWSYAGNFDSAPGTSEFATNLTGATDINDEIHVIVIDTDGLASGTKGAVLETYSHLSQGSNAQKSDGSTNYYKDVINAASEWIYFGNEGQRFGGALVAGTAAAANITSSTANGEFPNPSTDPDTAPFTQQLSGGLSDDTINAAYQSEIVTALNLFADTATQEINLLFAVGDTQSAGTGTTTVNAKLQSLAIARKDCVAFMSAPPGLTDGTVTDPVSNVTTYFGTTGVNTSTSYVVADSTAIQVYDKYHDKFVYIGAAGHIAGLCAGTDRTNDAWFSPAGETRGQLLGVSKLGHNPSKTDRDTLYKANINPLVSMPGRGTMLFGDKTRQFRASAFDRINVRRLFIVLEKAISTASEGMLFEFNDEFTRANFRNMVEPFLREVKGRRGITDFLVVCDETNNTGNIIDTNRFVADIFIKPARSINFITLNFIATRTGVEFSEIAGQ